MSEIYIQEPVDIVVQFLRSNITELSRDGLSNRHSEESQSFDGDGTTDVFTLTNQPLCIKSVTVNSVLQTLYLHYDIDVDNKLIRFNAGYIPTSGTGNIMVVFDTGDNWIYPDKPRSDLKKSSYPRIGVTHLTENGSDTGMGETGSYDNLNFQIDVVAYKDQVCTVGSDTIADADVAQYLARQVCIKIKRNRALIQNKLLNPTILNNFPVPFMDDKHIVKRIVEVKYEAINAGE